MTSLTIQPALGDLELATPERLWWESVRDADHILIRESGLSTSIRSVNDTYNAPTSFRWQLYAEIFIGRWSQLHSRFSASLCWQICPNTFQNQNPMLLQWTFKFDRSCRLHRGWACQCASDQWSLKGTCQWVQLYGSSPAALWVLLMHLNITWSLGNGVASLMA